MTLHTKLSYAKSGLRLVGYATLLWSIIAGVLILIASELIGIAEEAWPGAYEGTETDAKLENVRFAAQCYEDQINKIQEICLDAGLDPDEEGGPKTIVEAVRELARRSIKVAKTVECPFCGEETIPLQNDMGLECGRCFRQLPWTNKEGS
jgi:hypothetical protein